MTDNVYIFDKITRKRTLLGEIQANFNMSQVIDGSKDSATILVWSYIDFKIEPYTILWHENTNTWWVVSHDKIERYENENGALWVHNLDLLGAIELCNARDLTDCGFNDKTYTRGEFINRLIGLSTLEYDFEISTELALQPKVDFLKTFENYTLLAALREFLDAFNSCVKLTFTTQVISGETYIYKAIFNVALKTGNSNLTSHYFSDFTETKEIKIMDKSSFGTCVISNANNVVSTQAKTYPANGFKELSGTEYEITTDNAVLRLPSNVYKVNWIQLIATRVHITFQVGSQTITVPNLVYEADEYSKEQIVNRLQRAVEYEQITQSEYQFIVNELGIDYLWKKAKEYHTVTFYSDVSYNPDDTYTLGEKAPYIPVFKPSVTGNPQRVSLLPKEIRDCVQKHDGRIFAIYWERGSNLIKGFGFLEHNHKLDLNYTDGYYNDQSSIGMIYEDIDSDIKIYAHQPGVVELNFVFKSFFDTQRQPALFRINYIPMADLKLKVDNNRDKKDIKLYNQNGKFTDSYALSKLLNSYSKEIGSDSITKYAHYYDFASVPKVGSMVLKGNETYVINNVSMDFSINEDGYYIDCEFAMSKWVSTKSIMVNPNTNIRDYGIPQQYNVKRKQLYRDYYELSYETYDDANQEIPYLVLNKVVGFENEYKKVSQYIAEIKVVYNEQVGEQAPSDTWYYQLDCSTLTLNKQLFIHCDFLDNNIIGYSSTNRDFIFDVSHLFDQWSKVNVPITYTDDNGKLKDIEILFLNESEKNVADFEYFGYQPEPYDALLTQCFIPQELYEIAEDGYSFKIIENNYNKDALEVPVFEYCCQIDDSDYILIGDNILQQYEECLYFYDMIIGSQGQKLTQNQVYDNRTVSIYELQPIMEIYGAVKIEYNGSYELRIKYYEKVQYNTETKQWQFFNQQDIPTGVDIAIYRHAVNEKDTYDSDLYPQEKDLLLICKNVSSEHIIDDGKTLVLKVNYYKLK